jgi:hypothetical protein
VGKQQDYHQNNHSKKGWGVAQVVEGLSSKHKALSSNAVPPKKVHTLICMDINILK